jgi:hypothetical protein
MLRGGGPRPLAGSFLESEALQRSNGVEDKPTQIVVMGWTIPADVLDGGYIFPFLVRARDRKNIRVWLEDGSNDLENRAGSWPLQNIQLANSLKMKEYDFYLSFGNHQHSTEHGDAELPKAMTWLWRGYDSSKPDRTSSLTTKRRQSLTSE